MREITMTTTELQTTTTRPEKVNTDKKMRITLYGTRGSIASPSCREFGFITDEFGGDTTCYLLESPSGKKHIIDAGTGIRHLGIRLFKEGPQSANLYLTHMHRDHVEGMPFFGPAYAPSYRINVYAPNDLESASGVADPGRRALVLQQDKQLFPVPFNFLKGIATVNHFASGQIAYEDDEVIVRTNLQNHPGGSVSYAFQSKETKDKVIFANDFEPGHKTLDERLRGFWEGSRVVFSDGQYELGSTINNVIPGFGHSHPAWNIDTACELDVAEIIHIHHEPKMDDHYHRGLEGRMQAYAAAKSIYLKTSLGRQGKQYVV